MQNRMKNGMLARIGLFTAIAAMFGRDEMNATLERRKNNGFGHSRRGNGKVNKKGRQGQHRAGFKLYKKMCRRPRSPGYLHIGKDGRRFRKYIKRGYGYIPPEPKKVKEAVNAKV